MTDDELIERREGLYVQLLRQTLDLSDGLLDDMEESGNLQAVAKAIIAEDGERLREAVGIAAAVFADYARQHQEKAAQSSDSYEQSSRQHKAKRNADYAEEMRVALSQGGVE